MSDAEKKVIEQKLGYDPFKFKNIEELKQLVKSGSTDCLACPLLDKNKSCTIYEIRPLICRLFGLTKILRCPFGCKPTKWLKDKKAKRLLDLAASL